MKGNVALATQTLTQRLAQTCEACGGRGVFTAGRTEIRHEAGCPRLADGTTNRAARRAARKGN